MPTQDLWRHCGKCQGLFHGLNNTGVCIGEKLTNGHDYGLFTNDYVLDYNEIDFPGAKGIGGVKYPGQPGWRLCVKCQGLYFGDNATQGWCPAGGPHKHNVGSSNYRVLLNDPAAPPAPAPGLDPLWGWCYKCEAMYYIGKPSTSAPLCPNGGNHDNKNSGTYSLPFK